MMSDLYLSNKAIYMHHVKTKTTHFYLFLLLRYVGPHLHMKVYHHQHSSYFDITMLQLHIIPN